MADVRLIDANALPVHWGFISYDVGIVHGRFVAVDDIEDAPPIDAVPVVRCRDCKHHRNGACPMRSLHVATRGYGIQDNTVDDGFCHMGAKMNGGADDEKP